MANPTSAQRLQQLQQAAATWFATQRRDLNETWDLLDEMQAKRGGTVGLQDANAAGASTILANSISDYLGKLPSPPGV